MLISLAFRNHHKGLPPGNILAGDIGATKTNLAIFNYDGKTLAVKKEKKYHTKDFHDAETMITNFLQGEELLSVMCLGVAGPVQEGKVRITNTSIEIDSRIISKQFNNIPVHLINDLEATAYGLAALEKNDLYILHEGGKDCTGNMAIIAPGTGLGEAGLYWDGKEYHPFATEGGHCDFSPRTGIDIELYIYLQKKFGHVSWERLISGPGIFNIYEFLRLEKERAAAPWLAEKMLAHDKAAVITENAESVAICRETMELFLRYLATESANLALKLKATGGVFIGGGIIPKVLKLVHADSFLKWFCDCGRLRYMLQDIPVKIILNERTALLGAAIYGACTK